ncbi:hypothetical protein [Parasphingorhabdus halotolerans]|uniref:Uncharacterized protein n=1 Tax=Parasphingorhabdus halotolerans TaxID=2725558 RepID=A0A6H2DQY9_9SPHN|nr:hypothetical protein [Parasphingorhabdus halotolerans]QJB70086.1 hypothetical protein HF685_12975 [Parasphingorhabdus halotolerans]
MVAEGLAADRVQEFGILMEEGGWNDEGCRSGFGHCEASISGHGVRFTWIRDRSDQQFLVRLLEDPCWTRDEPADGIKPPFPDLPEILRSLGLLAKSTCEDFPTAYNHLAEVKSYLSDPEITRKRYKKELGRVKLQHSRLKLSKIQTDVPDWLDFGDRIKSLEKAILALSRK